MHALRPDDVEHIVTKTLFEKATKREVKRQGADLLGQWKELPPEQRADFCQNNVVPAINRLKNGTKRNAINVYRAVKEGIADHAVETMLRMEGMRQSARKVAEEMLSCYEVIEKVGRGVVYLGSARTKPGEKEYELGVELGREIATMLRLPSWSGAGPGAMEAPLMGAREAGGKTGGIKIDLSKNLNVFEQEVNPAIDPEDVALCDKFAPRKIGLVDAAMSPDGLVVTLPGGFGSYDEFFEVLTLKQLEKLSQPKIDIILMNYDGAYDKLLEAIHDLYRQKKINLEHIDLFKVFRTNRELFEYLATKRAIPEERCTFRNKVLLGEAQQDSQVA